MDCLDAVGTTAYSYTDFGALLSEDGPWADDTVSYSYTSNRLRSGMTLLLKRPECVFSSAPVPGRSND